MSDTLPGLDQLRELPLPATVPYWPQTWGWVVVALVVAIGSAWAATAGWRRHRRNRYRRQGLAELARLAKDVAADPLAARELPGLLKRTALAAQSTGSRTIVAGLSGSAWQAYLTRAAPRAFPDDTAQLLSILAYAPDDAVRGLHGTPLTRLITASRHWMEHHHVAP